MLTLLAPVVLVATAAASPQAEIESALTTSAAGWDDGNLERFVAIYADDAVFVSGGKIARGRAEIAKNYAKSFTGAANVRDRLSIQPVAWRTLSKVHVLFVGRWTLAPAGAAPQTGLTTLLFERRKAGWQIISDHSS